MKAVSMNGTAVMMSVLTAASMPMMAPRMPFAAAIMVAPALVVTAAAPILMFVMVAAAI